jgi:hypothetical protein
MATLAHTVRSNRYHPASKLLIPLSYAAILGGTMTLIETEIQPDSDLVGKSIT